jgi:STE24 endopeptidase
MLDATDQSVQTEAAPSPDEAEVKAYQRAKLSLHVASLILGTGYILFMAVLGGVWLDRLIEPWSLGSPWLGLVEFAVIFGGVGELLGLPLDFWASYVLEHRYQLSTQTVRGWVWKHIKSYFLAAVLGIPLLLGFYGLIWFTPEWWWLGAALAWLLVTLVLGQLLPVLILPLFYKVTRLDNPELSQRFAKLAEGTGLKVEGVYRLQLSDETRKANAALAGMGRTRRVLLGDTLLESLTPEEIDVVFAHEVGHHVHRHLPKLIVWSVVSATAAFWLSDVVLKNLAVPLGHASFDAVSALPLVVATLALIGLVLAPLTNALSRFFETQCDRYALERTQNPTAYRGAFEKLARTNKSDPNPSRWVVWLFYDHPPVRDRLALADRY